MDMAGSRPEKENLRAECRFTRLRQMQRENQTDMKMQRAIIKEQTKPCAAGPAPLSRQGVPISLSPSAISQDGGKFEFLCKNLFQI